MTITINTKTYGKDSNPSADSSVYSGPAETALVKDRFTLKRISPKRSGTSNGTARRVAKTTKTVIINGIAKDLVATTEYSYPADAAAADVTSLRVDHASAVSNATVMVPFVDKGSLEF